MKRIIMHWTAGAYAPNSVDLKAYHFVIDGDGKWHKGVDVSKNSGSLKAGYAAHTLNLNTDSIGVSLASMAGAVESPFNAGRYPITKAQVDSLVVGVADLCAEYGIPVNRKTVLSHAEVQPTLGVAQRQKWDFTRLPPYPDLKGAIEIGDWLRSRIAAAVPRAAETVAQAEPFPAGAVLEALATVATASTAGGPASGSVPRGTLVGLLEQEGGEVRVQTPAGYKVWAQAAAFRLAGVVDNEQTGAKPSSTRQKLSAIRNLIDEIEATLGDEQ
ncbi:MAG: peptidoglycan recognition family protein [Novosphingobium sp.]